MSVSRDFEGCNLGGLPTDQSEVVIRNPCFTIKLGKCGK